MPSIAEAKYKLFNRAPYFSALLAAIPLFEQPEPPANQVAMRPELANVPAAATPEGIYFFTRPIADMGLDAEECVGLLAHELFHYVLKFWTRLGTRDPSYWNLAQDAYINGALTHAGFKLPKNGVWPSTIGAPEGLTCDQYYDHLMATQPPPPPNACGTGELEGEGDPKDLDAQQEAKAQAMRVARAVRAFGKAAADHAKRNNGQGLGSLLEGLCEPEAEGKVDWRDALYGKVRAKISEIGGSDFAKFGRLSGRQAGLGYGNQAPRLPAWSKRKLDVAFAIDTSGSMGGILGAIQGELQSVCDMAGGVARLIQCDAEIGQDKVHRKGAKVALTGGGGTSFVPVFDLLAKTKRPDVLIYATDLYGEFPAAAPNYPVIWAVVGPCREVPFGDIVEIPT